MRIPSLISSAPIFVRASRQSPYRVGEAHQGPRRMAVRLYGVQDACEHLFGVSKHVWCAPTPTTPPTMPRGVLSRCIPPPTMPRGVLSRHTSTSHDATRRALSSHLPRIAQVTKSLAIDAPLCEPSRVTPSPRAFYPLLARLRFLYMGLLNLRESVVPRVPRARVQ